jgi:hypothetical protein
MSRVEGSAFRVYRLLRFISPLAVNKWRAERYLDTVEVRSSSLLVPTIFSITYSKFIRDVGSFW